MERPKLPSRELEVRKTGGVISQQRSLGHICALSRNSEVLPRDNRGDMIVDIQAATVVLTKDFTKPG
jgi:hypothetical protein